MIWSKQISEYIRAEKQPKSCLQIIRVGYFIQIFKHFNNNAHHCPIPSLPRLCLYFTRVTCPSSQLSSSVLRAPVWQQLPSLHSLTENSPPELENRLKKLLGLSIPAPGVVEVRVVIRDTWGMGNGHGHGQGHGPGASKNDYIVLNGTVRFMILCLFLGEMVSQHLVSCRNDFYHIVS